MDKCFKMTEPLLIQLIEKLYLANLKYCCVCLRTGEERRLEQPNYLKKFVQSLNQPYALDEKSQLVCFICERQAAAAFRFRVATNLAAQVQCAIKQLTKSRALREKVTAKFYNGELERDVYETGPGAVNSVLRCEARMRQLRAQTQLLYTEVLVISTPSTTSTEPSTEETTEILEDTVVADSYCNVVAQPGPGESDDQYVVPDDVPDHRRSELKSRPDQEMESIIIYDDDDPISITPTEPKLTEPKPTEPKPTEPKPTAKTNSHLLLALKTPQKLPNTNNKLLIGMVNPQNQPNTNESAPYMAPPRNPPKLVPIEHLLDQNNQLEHPATNYILHPIIFNSGMMTVPSLSANIINGQLITCENSTETPRIALQNGDNIDFISEPNKMANVLKRLSHQDATKVHIFTSADRSNSVTNTISKGITIDSGSIIGTGNVVSTGNIDASSVKKRGKSVSESDNSVSTSSKTVSEFCNLNEKDIRSANTMPKIIGRPKKATFNSDRIDWEDKIPMDVITFVDSSPKDEVAPKRARCEFRSPPPLGIICNVTSLSEKQDDVIDLC